MHRLLEQCFFAKEGATASAQGETRVSPASVQHFVDRGRARLIPLESGLVSVSVKEGSQSDVAGLFCGARSLVVDKENGEIFVRGVNKFFDLKHVDRSWMDDADVWDRCPVYAQRKMAGFVVTLFSPDGERLRCMSKHSFEGPHVEMAVAMLDAALSPAQQQAMASNLFRMDVTASCECISRENDFHHPVLELPCFDDRLVLFSVQRRRTVQEQALPFREAEQWASAWGLPCTQAHRLGGRTALMSALAATHPWDAHYSEFTSPTARLAEGLVILIEVRDSANGRWVRPLRLKAKTTAYVALRSLRSLIRGDSQPRLLLYHRAVMAWAAARAPGAAADFLRTMEERGGVSSIEEAFRNATAGGDREGELCTSRRRHRQATLCVGQAHTQLLTITEREVSGDVDTTAAPPLSTLLFCGLPGAGKSTLCERLLQSLSLQKCCPFRYGVVLKKDEVTRAVSERMGITPESSRHKKRRVGAPVHREVLRRLQQIRLFASVVGHRVLLLFDACSATPNTRQAWRDEVVSPGQADDRSCRVVYVQCSDQSMLAARVGTRPSHELLADAAEAQRALYNVRSKFVPPTAQENAIVLDTAVITEEGAVAELVSALERTRAAEASRSAAPPDGGEALQRLSFAELEASLKRTEDDILNSLLGVERGSSSAAPAVLAELSAHGAKRRQQSRSVIAVTLPACTFTELRDLVANVLSRMLAPTTAPAEAERGTMVSKLAASVRGMLTSALQTRPTPSLLDRACGEGTPRLLAGHTRWLAGWLFRGKLIEATRQSVAAALAERFDQVDRSVCPHATLLYSADGKTGVEEFWAESGLKLKDAVAVDVEELLVDRHAMCLSARLVQTNRIHQWPADTPTPAAAAEDGGEEDDVAADDSSLGPRLHITLGTAPGVKSGYCGGMFPAFVEWEAQNAAVRSKQERNTASRSRDKFVNFLHARLPERVRLEGIVADIS